MDIKKSANFSRKGLPKMGGSSIWRRVEFRKLGRRTLAFNARRLENRGEFAVLLAIEDVTK